MALPMTIRTTDILPTVVAKINGRAFTVANKWHIIVRDGKILVATAETPTSKHERIDTFTDADAKTGFTSRRWTRIHAAIHKKLIKDPPK